MPWKYNNATIRPGKEFTGTDGTQYSKVWMRYSDSQKEAIGISWEAELGPYDNFYYWGWNSDGDALLPKPLADLQVSKVREAKNISASMLNNTDWYVIRKTETSTAIPSEITAYRTAVRTNYAALKTAISNASDIAGLQAVYTTTAGASSTAKEIDATSSSVVSTSDNTITINGHGFVNDEQVYYNAGMNSDDEAAAAIGGLTDGKTYYIIDTATNTFKLSESHSNCGDAAAVSLTGLSSDGDSQTFTSGGKPSAGQTWPNSDMPKYDGA